MIALLKRQVLRHECLRGPAVLEIENNSSFIALWISNEAHDLVADLVVVLNAGTVQSVVFDSGQIPRCILSTLVTETIEEPADDVAYVENHVISSCRALLALSVSLLALSVRVDDITSIRDLVVVIIVNSLNLIDLVVLSTPSLSAPGAKRLNSFTIPSVVLASSFKICGDYRNREVHSIVSNDSCLRGIKSGAVGP